MSDTKDRISHRDPHPDGPVTAAVNVPAAPETITEIKLRAHWDAALSYDILDLKASVSASPRGKKADPSIPPAPSPAVFVGREELLGGLAEAIADPERRGTYLISGYRGVGKTSLLIEAARRAKEDLNASKRCLLPIVLNVSEVSASLESSTGAAPKTLTVDARRLLTAMFRELYAASPAIKQACGDGDAVLEQIRRGHQKAVAAQYSERQRGSAERARSSQSAKTWTLQSPDLLKSIATIAGLVALVLAGWAVGRAIGVVTAAVAGLGGVAVMSYTRSRTMTATATTQESAEEDVTFDNSLHRLESDLKDILAELRNRNLRTIVVLEELDKLPNDAGDQLDRVIRYFKNLFTQAPALFFFLTDKEYFDLIAHRIAEARGKRNYAIEHTFFTTRLFVRRPSAEDCLAYLESIFEGDDAKAIVAVVRDADASVRTRPLAAMSVPGERLVRSLLFLAQDHMFDLKNEIRRYVRVSDDGSFWLQFDAASFGPNEQNLAPFQFLLEQKIRSYRFPGGREYADEVLRDSVSAVFADLGSTVERETSYYYPDAGSGSDELTPAVQRRIASAVDSIVRDLVTGGAVEEQSKIVDGRTTTVITWREDGATSFRPPANLEPHELALVRHFDELAADLQTLFGYDGRLRWAANMNAVATSGDELYAALGRRKNEASGAPTAMTAEAAATATRVADRQVADVADAAAQVLRARLEQTYGIGLVQPNPDTSSSLWTLRAAPSQRVRHDSSPVLVVFGSDSERRGEVLHTLRPSSLTEARVAVIVVDSAPTGSVNFMAERDHWVRELDLLPAGSVMLRWISLDTGVTVSPALNRSNEEATAATATWGERLADEVVRAALWTEQNRWSFALADQPLGPVWLRAGDGIDEEHPSLASAVTKWWGGGDRVLATPGRPSGPGLDQIASALTTNHDTSGPTAIVLPAAAADGRADLLESYVVTPTALVERLRPLLYRGEVVLLTSIVQDVESALRQGARVLTELQVLLPEWPVKAASVVRSVADPASLGPIFDRLADPAALEPSS